MGKYTYTSENAETYNSLGIENTTYALEFEEVARLLGNISGKTFLDFGCGSGRSSEFLVSLGAEKVVGVDHNESMLSEARSGNSKNIEYVKIGDTLPFEGSSFDGATALSVFIEIRTKEQMLSVCKEIARVLKPGASFVIGSTSPQAFGKTFRNFSYTEPETRNGGELTTCTVFSDGKSFDIEDTYWNESDYVDVLTESGFTVESIIYPLPEDKGNWETDESHTSPFIVVLAKKHE